MNKRIVIIISFFAFLFIIGSIITLVLANNSIIDNNVNIEKASSHIRYLDTEIIAIANMLNNINLENNDNILNRGRNIDWLSIENSISKLYTNWNYIIIDFNNINIKNTSLTDFGKTLDKVAISVKNKNKTETLSGLTDLYHLLVVYTDSYNIAEEFKNNINTKYYLLKAYSLMDSNNWTLINENILKAEHSYYNNINSIKDDDANQFNKNKIYVAIKELENISISKDIDLFYLKYTVAMKNLMN